MPVNYGVLQPINQMSPIRTILGSPMTSSSGADASLMNAQTAKNAQFASSMSQMGEQLRANRLMPGELAKQQADIEHASIVNKAANLDLQTKQQEFNFHQADLKAFQAGSQKGGVSNGLDAMYESMYKHDPAGAMTLKQTQENLTASIASKNTSQLGQVGNIAVTIAQSKDPLQQYKDQYEVIKKVYPDAPDPTKFKNSLELFNQFLQPTMSLTYPYAKQMELENQLKMKQQTPTDLEKTQNLIAKRKEELKSIIAEKGANSNEAKDAMTNLSEAEQESKAILYGHSPFGELEHSAASKISGQANSALSRFQAPEGQAPQQTQSLPQVPKGTVLMKSKDGQLGYIPQEQLDDAVKEGYSPVTQ